MSLAAADSQRSYKTSQDPKFLKCMLEKPHSGKTTCPSGDHKKELPVIKEAERKAVKKGLPNETCKSCVVLPKLKLDEISEQRIDAGEPHDSSKSSVSCANQRQFHLLDVSSNEALELSTHLSGSLPPSESSSTRFRRYQDFKKLQGQKEILEESHALQRWEYWLKDKKRIQNHLSKQLKRPACDLMLQESDKYRQVMEQKLLNWYTRLSESEKNYIPSHCEPQTQIRSKKIYDRSCSIKPKPEVKERKPELEFIGISNTIKIEKGLLLDGDDKRAVDKKVHRKDEGKCDSLEIKMSQLAVVGRKISNDVNGESLHTSSDVTVVIDSADAEQASASLDRKSVFCLAIGGEEIMYEIGSDCCQHHDKSFAWNVDFGITMAGSIAEKVFRIENRGTMAVRYYWLSPKYETEKKLSLNVLQPRHFEPCFFFNKNSGHFLPGQVYDLKFYFQMKTSGIRKETWSLKTIPPLSKDAEFASITLSGVATEEFSTETENLEFYLQRRKAESCVSFILDIILYKVLDPANGLSDIEYRSLFNDKQLFEYQNPKHYYNSTIVRELKKTFEEIAGKTQKEWDLSLSTLWRLIRAKKVQEETATEVKEKSKMLYRPNYLPVRNIAEYKMTYGILSKMMNTIDEEYIYLRSLVSERIDEPGTLGDWGEAKESGISFFGMPGEEGEADVKIEMLHIKPINLIFFRTLFGIKVYCRLCEAVEGIAAALETRKLFKPWKTVNYNPPKPRKAEVTPECFRRDSQETRMKYSRPK